MNKVEQGFIPQGEEGKLTYLNGGVTELNPSRINNPARILDQLMIKDQFFQLCSKYRVCV